MNKELVERSKCPHCGAKLRIDKRTNDIGCFACGWHDITRNTTDYPIGYRAGFGDKGSNDSGLSRI